MRPARQILYRPENGKRGDHRHAFAMKHALYVYPTNWICTYIPKNACSPLRYSIAAANGFGEDFARLENVQSALTASLSEVLGASYTFVFLRCPYRRLASMFLDKIGREPRRFASLLRPFERAEGLSFRRFVERAAKHPLGDHHWTPQSHFLLYRDYDDVFSVERAGEGFEKLSRTIPIHDTRQTTGHTAVALERVEGAYADTRARSLIAMRAEGRLPDYASLYDADLRGIVARAYAEDLRLYQQHFGAEALLFH